MLANGVKETTATTGTGSTLTLSAVSGFVRVSDAFGVGEHVWYGLESGDGSREWGYGAVGASNTFERLLPTATYVSGTYDKTTPSRISLSGTSTLIVVNHAASENVAPPRIANLGSSDRRSCNLPVFNAGSLGSFAIGANAINYFPVFWPGGYPIGTIYADITTAAAGKYIRLGLYELGEDGAPQKLIVDSGALSVASATQISASIGPLSLTSGWYAGAMLSDGAPSVRATNVYGETPFGWASGTARYKTCVAYKSLTYDALPNPASVSSLSTTNTGSSNLIPLIWLGE